jgi:hypothetical protein
MSVWSVDVHYPVKVIDEVNTAVMNQTFNFETDPSITVMCLWPLFELHGGFDRFPWLFVQDFKKNAMKLELWEWNPSSRTGQEYLGKYIFRKDQRIPNVSRVHRPSTAGKGRH